MKKIFFIRFKHSDFGGAENYLSRLIGALREKNIEYEVLSTGDYGANSTRFDIPKIAVFSFLKPLIFNFLVCRYLDGKEGVRFSLERIECADVYRAGDGVHREWLDVRRQNESALKYFFTSLNPLHTVYLFLEKRVFQDSKIIIANSQRGKDEIIKHYHIEPSKIEVVYNGIPHPSYDKLHAKQKLVFDFGVPIILFVGSGFHRKGVMHYLNILSLIKAPFLGIVIGKDKYQSKYEALAKRLGLGEKVRFLGSQKGIEDYYAASDIFLFPTLYEPFSNATLEALYFGNAVFTTEQNGASEIIPHKNQIMQTPKSYEISSEIEALLNDKERLKRVQGESRSVVLELSLEKNLEQTLNIINKI